jgi:hypothetical protein
MTRERKRALMILLLTFIVGIVIGVLACNVGGKYYGRKGQRGWREGGREGFVSKVLHVVEASPEQQDQIKPLLEETMTRIDSLQMQTDRRVRGVVDSLEIKITPILKPEQLERLKEFHSRGREQRRH